MIRFSAVLVGVLLITVAIVLGPLYTASGYSIATNLVSELGAQHMPNAWIMNAGFIAFGVGVTVSAARRARATPFTAGMFLVFGMAMALAGVFSHQPLDRSTHYDELAARLHSLCATVAGFAFTIGAFAQSLHEREERCWACWVAAASATGLPLLMLADPSHVGLTQRLMFVVTFLWLVVFLPSPRPRAQD